MGRFNFSVKRTNFVFMKEADKRKTMLSYVWKNRKRNEKLLFFSIVLKKQLNPIHEAILLNTLMG